MQCHPAIKRRVGGRKTVKNGSSAVVGEKRCDWDRVAASEHPRDQVGRGKQGRSDWINCQIEGGQFQRCCVERRRVIAGNTGLPERYINRVKRGASREHFEKDRGRQIDRLGEIKRSKVSDSCARARGLTANVKQICNVLVSQSNLDPARCARKLRILRLTTDGRRCMRDEPAEAFKSALRPKARHAQKKRDQRKLFFDLHSCFFITVGKPRQPEHFAIL